MFSVLKMFSAFMCLNEGYFKQCHLYPLIGNFNKICILFSLINKIRLKKKLLLFEFSNFITY